MPAHHDGAETAIFERVMSEYTKELHTNQSAVPASMRLPMADMIADYGSDVHQILGKKMDGPTDFNQLEIDRGDLTRIIRATAEDANAFKMIHGSQSVVTGEGLERFQGESFRKPDPAPDPRAGRSPRRPRPHCPPPAPPAWARPPRTSR
ncbi:hypothetical protein [Streptomyces sp. TE33382]